MKDNPIQLLQQQIDGHVFGDARLEKRGASLYEALCEGGCASIQQISRDWAEQMAYYRFLNNDRVTLGA